ncbi:hypothetical protein LTR17_009771 [Elasticomyces elasticus]|nr:hypothetical protein LTR17_009771 [Elasticomyces elasticus]
MDKSTPAAESTKSAMNTSIPAVVSADFTLDISTPALESTKIAAEMQRKQGGRGYQGRAPRHRRGTHELVHAGLQGKSSQRERKQDGDYNPQPTPSGFTSRNPNAPKRQKRAAGTTPAHSSVASAETGGDQGDNTFCLLEDNHVIKGGSRMLLKLVEFPDFSIDPKKGLTKQAAVSKKKYSNQYTPFKRNQKRGSHASPSHIVDFMPTRPMALPRGQSTAVEMLQRRPQFERKTFDVATGN